MECVCENESETTTCTVVEHRVKGQAVLPKITKTQQYAGERPTSPVALLKRENIYLQYNPERIKTRVLGDWLRNQIR